MKNMTLFLSLLLLPLAVKSQIKMPYNKETVTIAIEVVDSLTQKNIANVTFGHFSAQRCYTANDKGKLYITILKSYLNDTLYIDLQNYQPKSITFNALAKLKKLYLQPKPVQQQAQTIITADKTIVLNDFDWKETEHYVGLPNPLQPFPYLQIAQRFDNPNELLILTKIKIGHLFFYLPDHVANGPLLSMQSSMPTNPASEAQARPVIDRSYPYNYIQRSSFRVRIYSSCNPATGYPLEDLCYRQINVYTEDNPISINLAKYDIKIPKGQFFIAVEWVRSNENLSYILPVSPWGTYYLFSTFV